MRKDSEAGARVPRKRRKPNKMYIREVRVGFIAHVQEAKHSAGVMSDEGNNEPFRPDFDYEPHEISVP